MRLILSLLLLSSAISIRSFSQTCVVVKLVGKTIYAGADSRIVQTHRSNTGKWDTLLFSSCKIHNIGKFNFVIAGDFPYSSVKIAINKCNSNNYFKSAMDSYCDSYGQLLADSLVIYKDNIRPKFDALYSRGFISEIVFFGFENNQPIIIKLLFKIKDFDTRSVNVTYDSTTNITFAAIGHFNHMGKFVKSNSGWNNPIQRIKQLINIEIKADTIEVGKPIDVIEVTNKKHHWANRKDSCPITDLL